MKALQASSTTPDTKNITICFDIDGCLALLSSQCAKMPKVYKQVMLDRLKDLFFNSQIRGDKVCNTHITLRLFTNRKDAKTDAHNMNQNNTLSAKRLLADLAGSMHNWLDNSSSLSIDDRYHVEQTFASSIGACYDDLLETVQVHTGQQSASQIFAGKASAGNNKLDLAATILADHAHTGQTHHIFFMDDRLNPDNPEKGLDDLQAFFKKTPHAIPGNCSVNMVQFDPFIDECRHHEDAINWIQKAVSSTRNTAKKREQIIAQTYGKLKASGFHNLADKVVSSIVQEAYNIDIGTGNGIQAYRNQQQALCHRDQIQGVGIYPRITSSDELWAKILMPVGDTYQQFLADKAQYSDNVNPFVEAQAFEQSIALDSAREEYAIDTMIAAFFTDFNHAEGLVPNNALTLDQSEQAHPMMSDESDLSASETMDKRSLGYDQESQQAKRAKAVSDDEGRTDSESPLSVPSHSPNMFKFI